MVEAPVPIDHAHAFAFEMRQVVERIKNGVTQAALPR